jgi:hypothetical protein
MVQSGSKEVECVFRTSGTATSDICEMAQMDISQIVKISNIQHAKQNMYNGEFSIHIGLRRENRTCNSITSTHPMSLDHVRCEGLPRFGLPTPLVECLLCY